MGKAISQLDAFDLLIILSYHWPGNVREIENIADAYKWRDESSDDMDSTWFSADSQIYNPIELNTDAFYERLNEWVHIPDVYYALQEKLLDNYNLSLEPIPIQPFEEEVPDTFEREYKGLQLFCKHTGQDIRANRHLMNLEESEPGKREARELDIAELNHKALQKLYLQTLLQRTGGNKAEAARKAGLNYQTFQSMLKRYEIK